MGQCSWDPVLRWYNSMEGYRHRDTEQVLKMGLALVGLVVWWVVELLAERILGLASHMCRVGDIRYHFLVVVAVVVLVVVQEELGHSSLDQNLHWYNNTVEHLRWDKVWTSLDLVLERRSLDLNLHLCSSMVELLRRDTV